MVTVFRKMQQPLRDFYWMIKKSSSCSAHFSINLLKTPNWSRTISHLQHLKESIIKMKNKKINWFFHMCLVFVTQGVKFKEYKNFFVY